MKLWISLVLLLIGTSTIKGYASTDSLMMPAHLVNDSASAYINRTLGREIGDIAVFSSQAELVIRREDNTQTLSNMNFVTCMGVAQLLSTQWDASKGTQPSFECHETSVRH